MPQLSDQQAGFIQRHLGAVAKPPKTKPPVTEDENARLDELPIEVLMKTDLTQVDMQDLFSRDSMQDLKDIEIKGADSPDLNKLMKVIAKGVSGKDRDTAMADLEAIVGKPPSKEELDVDYGRFLVVKKQQEAKGDAKEKESPGLSETLHGDFMGSKGQLMFGTVLGEAFGIHEVFAALLSPTGGLVGPGNAALRLDPDNPVSLHGTVHDAAGYLGTFHDQGPGYDYLDSPLEVLPTGWPVSGQISGVLYWLDEAGEGSLLTGAESAVVALEKKLEGARDAVADLIEDMLSGLDAAKDAAVDAAMDAKDAVFDARDAAVDAAVDTRDAAIEAAKDIGNAVSETADEVGDKVVKTAEEMGDTVAKTAEDIGNAVAETADDVGDAMAETAEDVSDAVARAASEAADMASGAAKDLKDGAMDVADAVGDIFERLKNAAKEKPAAKDKDAEFSMSELAKSKFDAAASFIWD